MNPQIDLLENITKIKSEKNNEKPKKLNFDIRCYGNILIVKSAFIELFTTLNIEILPVNIILFKEDYSYLNVLTIIESINFDNSDHNKSMEMIKSNNITFIKNNISTTSCF